MTNAMLQDKEQTTREGSFATTKWVSSHSGPLPLAGNQTGLWFVQQVEPDTAAYNLVFSARIQSHVNIDLLKKAFDIVVQRHEALRISFERNVDGEVAQTIKEQRQADFDVIDVNGWSDEEIKQCALRESKNTFDLNESVLHARLLMCSEHSSVLVLVVHHIAIDFWSLAVILEELKTIYSCGGESAELPPVNNQFSDYVHWQQSALKDGNLKQHELYWTEKFAGDLPVMDLMTDKRRPNVQTYRGASTPLSINAQLTQQLKNLAKDNGCTLYMILLAAFQVLLYRYSGNEDILIGSPVAGRTRKQFRNTVGNFVNTIVLRNSLDKDMPFSDYLRNVKQTVIDAIRHQDYPFPLIVKNLQPKRDISRTPIFQTSFAWERLPQFHELDNFFVPRPKDVKVDFGGLILSPYPLPQQEGQVDLTLELGAEIDDRLTGALKFNTDLFEHDTAAAMAEHFETILESIVAQPDNKLGCLSLISSLSRDWLTSQWQNKIASSAPFLNAHQIIELQAEQTPHNTAVSCMSSKITYQKLNQQANQLAHYLRSLGVEEGDRVGVCLDRSTDLVATLLGVMKSGAAYVPLDPQFPKDRLEFIQHDAGLSFLITEESIASFIETDVDTVLYLEELLVTSSFEPYTNTPCYLSEESEAYVIYTSGSTGKPKGVRVSHRSLSNLLRSFRKNPGLQEKDVMLAVTTLAFDISVLEIFLPLTAGGETNVVPREISTDGVKLRQLLEQSNATVMQCTPATWRMLIDAGWRGDNRLNMWCGGESLPQDLANQLLDRGGDLWNLYGPTETTVWSTTHKVSRDDTFMSIGKPIEKTQLYILDDDLKPVPAGIVGELYIGGDGVAVGYNGRPELTRESFIENPFMEDSGARMYRTRDLARYHASGSIELLGRADHQIKLRGYRIELGEIETVLRGSPYIVNAVVILREDQPGDKRLVAYLVPTEGVSVDLTALKDCLKQSLPSYMIPAQFEFLESLPLTPNNKIDRRALPVPKQTACVDNGYVAPRDALEMTLARIWEKVLNLPAISVEDDFFDLGGHSLLAVRLMSEIEKAMGAKLPASLLFQSGTIAALAHYLRQQKEKGNTTSSLAVKFADGGRPTLFLFHPIGGNVFCYKALSRHLQNEYTIYAIQSSGLDSDEPDISIEDMSAQYIQVMREIQPNGPYYLGGWCFGGVVAFEIAQQLRQQGQEIASIVMFDTRAPIPENAPDNADDATLLSWFARDLAVPFNKTLNIPPEELRKMEPDQMFDYVLDKARKIKVIPFDAEHEVLQRYFNVYIANGIALQSYEPRAYGGKVSLFRAQDEKEDYGPTLGWSKLLSALTIIGVPGDHSSVMYEPNVRELAQQIGAHMLERGKTVVTRKVL